jgi:hypothetical protein
VLNLNTQISARFTLNTKSSADLYTSAKTLTSTDTPSPKICKRCKARLEIMTAKEDVQPAETLKEIVRTAARDPNVIDRC